ncbi:hypothetical protein EG328_003910 [Venturia inaequalis]|uniref:Uncharacterized protein n=1 Tax=Venturia inaequalis TaxID=5025 RepID=A0A8H3ZGM3_VENIN|nr:hypothetical protein EG328_003910 [Venturia inaequalis]KAE9992622.1 hypothetical protein EG327_008365 [Venturia inaequalis]RDI77460.1 hypothetical protein Vi05172_g12553 [Venturia inaequalis]
MGNSVLSQARHIRHCVNRQNPSVKNPSVKPDTLAMDTIDDPVATRVVAVANPAISTGIELPRRGPKEKGLETPESAIAQHLPSWFMIGYVIHLGEEAAAFLTGGQIVPFPRSMKPCGLR